MRNIKWKRNLFDDHNGYLKHVFFRLWGSMVFWTLFRPQGPKFFMKVESSSWILIYPFWIFPQWFQELYSFSLEAMNLLVLT